jgi:hypothetical protein
MRSAAYWFITAMMSTVLFILPKNDVSIESAYLRADQDIQIVQRLHTAPLPSDVPKGTAYD